jgi:dethiobiotin synthetase
MRRFVVTGTDTDVGKTVVTACLAAGARSDGARVLAAKPVASGVPAGTWGDDATALAAAAGHDPLVRVRLVAPLSPHRAAALEGIRLDTADLRAWIAGLDADLVLIEGVGGWRVPLAVDPVVELRDIVPSSSVIVVAANRLGVLNHVRLTVDAVQRDGFAVAGVVLSDAAPPDASTDGNAADLRALLAVPVVRLPKIHPADPTALARAGSDLWASLAC